MSQTLLRKREECQLCAGDAALSQRVLRSQTAFRLYKDVAPQNCFIATKLSPRAAR